MKLRNKKTGEIIDYYDGLLGDREVGGYGSLAELTAEWEDYEEPHETYRLTSYGEAVRFSSDGISNAQKRECVNIGNYFSTKEEAEKAVEKLKAWKRLKEAGFEFKGWKVLDHDSPRIYFNVYRKNSDDIVPFLDLLFGGENE